MIIRTKLTVRYLFKSGFCNIFDQVMIIDKYASLSSWSEACVKPIRLNVSLIDISLQTTVQMLTKLRWGVHFEMIIYTIMFIL